MRTATSQPACRHWADVTNVGPMSACWLRCCSSHVHSRYYTDAKRRAVKVDGVAENCRSLKRGAPPPDRSRLARIAHQSVLVSLQRLEVAQPLLYWRITTVWHHYAFRIFVVGRDRTSNLVDRLIVPSASPLMASYAWKGRGQVTWTIWILVGTNHISRTAEARVVKFCTHVGYVQVPA